MQGPQMRLCQGVCRDDAADTAGLPPAWIQVQWPSWGCVLLTLGNPEAWARRLNQ